MKKNKEKQVFTEKERNKGIIRTSLVGIGGNALLVAMKATVGFIAGSVSIIMDALNNLTDALSSIITIIGTKLSGKNPDKKHPYGHGRVEYITSSLIGAVILFAGGSAIYKSIESIINHFKTGELPSYDNYAFFLISAAIVIKIGLGIFYQIKGKKYNSSVLKASGLDALFDSLLTLSTLIGAIVSRFASTYVEGYIGVVIGIFILRTGFEIVREAISNLIGVRIDQEFANEIKAEIAQFDGVKGVYDLILNNYGHSKFIGSVHVGVDESFTAKDIHILEREIGVNLYLKHNIIMTVGIYCETVSSPIGQEIKNKIIELIKENPFILQLHGFYIDEGTKSVYFDLVFDYQEKDPGSAVNSLVIKLVEAFEGYSFYPVIDRDF